MARDSGEWPGICSVSASMALRGCVSGEDILAQLVIFPASREGSNHNHVTTGCCILVTKWPDHDHEGAGMANNLFIHQSFTSYVVISN